MSDPVSIGILGDYDPKSPTLPAVEKSLQHCPETQSAGRSGMDRNPSMLAPDAQKKLESFDGLWAAPGSPYKSFDGMLKGIEFARRRDWPFLGTCGGFQYALIECARNVLGIKDADSAENNSGSKNIVIYPVACAVPNRERTPQAFRSDTGNPPASWLLSAVVLFAGHGRRRILLQLRSQPRIRMGRHGSRISGGGSRAARRGSRHRIAHSPFLYRNALPAPAIVLNPAPHPLVLAFVQAAADWGRKSWMTSVLE